MSYNFFALPNHYTQMRTEIFLRMQKEGLVSASMHGEVNPTLVRWLEITDPHKGWLLCCVPSSATQHTVDILCGVAWLEPWRGRVWSFDFTAFRPHFNEAPNMSKQALIWIFEHAPCDSIIGICPVSNAHAWRLAPKSGFEIVGKIPNACLQAKRNKYEDGILVLACK